MDISTDQYKNFRFTIQNFTTEQQDEVMETLSSDGYEAAVQKATKIIAKRNAPKTTDEFEPNL